MGTVERIAVGTAVALGLAAVVFTLLGIWTRDYRWLATAGVAVTLVLLAIMVPVINQTPRR
jgi:membrane protein YdbS with pleckstrin-like domain